MRSNHSTVEAWEADGYAVLPGFLDSSEAARLAAVCETIVDRWRAENAKAPWLDRTTNMSGLTERRYFEHPSGLNGLNGLIELIELIGDARVLDVLRACLGSEPLFHNTQFFFEQRETSWDGDWHRDTQFDARDDADERHRMDQLTGVHFRFALAEDACLEIVPGSHRRWDRGDELAIRKAPDPERRSDAAMAGARRIELEAGDALVFHAWSIHRGIYRTRPIRRTLDVIYGSDICPFGVPAPTCFADRAVLDRLTPAARRFFERFVAAYESQWSESPHIEAGAKARSKRRAGYRQP